MLITNLWISIEDCSKAILHNSWYFVQLVGCPKATFGLRTRRQPHSHLILITAIYQVCPEGHQEPCTKVGSQSLAKCISRIELGTFQFWVWSAIPLHPSPSMVHFQLKKIVALLSHITKTSKMVLLLTFFLVSHINGYIFPLLFDG